MAVHSITLELDSREFAALEAAASELGTDPHSLALSLVRKGLECQPMDAEARRESVRKALKGFAEIRAQLSERGVDIDPAKLIREIRDEAEARYPLDARHS